MLRNLKCALNFVAVSFLESSAIWKHPQGKQQTRQQPASKRYRTNGQLQRSDYDEANDDDNNNDDGKMVAGPVGNFHSELRNDPLVREMRRVRELNAQRYKEDYSHIFRLVSSNVCVTDSAIKMQLISFQQVENQMGLHSTVVCYYGHRVCVFGRNGVRFTNSAGNWR